MLHSPSRIDRCALLTLAALLLVVAPANGQGFFGQRRPGDTYGPGPSGPGNRINYNPIPRGFVPGPRIPGDVAPALPSQGTNRYLLGIYSDVVNVWQQADGGWWGWGPGLRIRSIIPGSSAQGVFDPNDIIVRVNGDRVRSQGDLTRMLQQAGAQGGNTRLTFRNVRNGRFENRDVQLRSG